MLIADRHRLVAEAIGVDVRGLSDEAAGIAQNPRKQVDFDKLDTIMAIEVSDTNVKDGKPYA